jgi:hypothetical protein
MTDPAERGRERQHGRALGFCHGGEGGRANATPGVRYRLFPRRAGGPQRNIGAGGGKNIQCTQNRPVRPPAARHDAVPAGASRREPTMLAGQSPASLPRPGSAVDRERSDPRDRRQPCPGTVGPDPALEDRGPDPADPPPVGEGRPDLLSGDPAGEAEVPRLELAEREHDIGRARPHDLGEAPDEPRAVEVGEGMKEAGVDDAVEGPAELPQLERSSSASHTRNVAPRSRSRARRRATSIARGAESTPPTACPRPARKRAFSPVPQPTSSTSPAISPDSSRDANSRCALPMSHGGGDR